MTAWAEHCRVGQLRGDFRRIRHVIGQRTVAGFAVHARVLARLLERGHVVVTVLTNFVPGEFRGVSRNFGKGVTAKVAVLAETTGHKHEAKCQKGDHTREEYRCNPEEVFEVLEPIHGAIR